MALKVSQETYSLLNGGVAQLGEHLPCKQGVRSSTLLISTIFKVRVSVFRELDFFLIHLKNFTRNLYCFSRFWIGMCVYALQGKNYKPFLSIDPTTFVII